MTSQETANAKRTALAWHLNSGILSQHHTTDTKTTRSVASSLKLPAIFNSRQTVDHTNPSTSSLRPHTQHQTHNVFLLRDHLQRD